MYKIIAVISVFVRQFCLPNPFEPLGNDFTIKLFELEFPMPPVLLNLLAEGIIHSLTFSIVGIYYRKRIDPPAKGSILYLLFYCIHIGILYLLSIFNFALWAIIAVIILYIMAHVGINILKNKLTHGGIY